MNEIIKKNSEEDLNIFNIFETIFKYKFFIILCVFSLTFLLGLTLYFFPKSYKGSIRLDKPTGEYIARFYPVNAMNKQITDFLAFKPDIITKLGLEAEFLDALRQDKFLNEFKSKFFFNKENVSNEAEKKLNFFIKSLNISSEKIRIDKRVETIYIINFVTHNIDEAKEMVSKLFQFLNIKTKELILNKYSFLKKSIQLQIAYSIKEKKDKINIEVANYKILIDRRIKLLKEHAQLARDLKIDKPVKYILDSNETSELTFYSNYYKKGYIFIDKEIAMLKNRTIDPLNFIINYPEIKKNIDLLSNNSLSKKLDDALYLSPLYNEEFSAVIFNSSKVKFRSSKNSKIILIGGFILNFIFSIVIILIYDSYKKYKLKN